MKKQTASKYVGKVQARQARKDHRAAHPMPRSDLEDLFLDGQD